MSELLDLQDKIRHTQAELARIELSLAVRPHSESLNLSLGSLRKRLWDLEEAYLLEADKLGVEICRYRLFSDDRQPTVTAVANVLGDFQRLISTVYAALRYGPKERARLSQDVLENTELPFGYSFAGSLGVVMTVPNDRLLLGETILDEAMSTVFDMAKSETPGAVAAFAQRLGPSVVRLVYKWAGDHAAAKLGADIQWLRRDKVRGELLIHQPEIARLTEVISQTSAEIEESLEVTGELRGADLDSHLFHLRVGETDIRGRFGDAITAEQRAELPRAYRAILRRTEKIIFAMEKPEESYFLVRLEPPPVPPDDESPKGD